VTLRESILRNELRRLGNSVAELAETIEQAEDFPTDTAKELCKIIRWSAHFVASRISALPEAKLIYVYVLLVEWAAHLRYSERSRIEHTPWSIVQATEDFLQSHIRTPCKFIIRPQWNYNYGLQGGFIGAYTSRMRALSEWFSFAEWKKEIRKSLRGRIYCISFPRVEKMNVLAHVNWGHEVGHILAAEWIDSKFGNLWRRNRSDIRSAIRKEVLSHFPAILKVPKPFINKQVAKLFDNTMRLAKAAMKELISDSVGAHLFGPATLAALAEMSCHGVIDANPLQGKGYPPWRLRLRMVGKKVVPPILKAKANWNPNLQEYADWVDEWFATTKDKSDEKVVKLDVQTREAYALIKNNWSTIWKEVLENIPIEKRKPYRIVDRQAVIGELVDRLNLGIPPNEIGTWPDTEAASLPDIWNAAWAYKVKKIRSETGEALDEHLLILSKLTLKAIEESYVQGAYGPSLRKLETT
jgi:hypothetical protein